MSFHGLNFSRKESSEKSANFVNIDITDFFKRTGTNGALIFTWFVPAFFEKSYIIDIFWHSLHTKTHYKRNKKDYSNQTFGKNSLFIYATYPIL